MRSTIQVFARCLLLFLCGLGSMAPARAASSAGAGQLVSGSVVTANPGGNGDSGLAIISHDGRFVLFASTANNLTLTNNNNSVLPSRFNVFLRDTVSNTTTLVSINQSGTGGGNGDSFPTGLSTNGQFALFESTAGDLVANAANCTNVFVRDLINGLTTLVSVGGNGFSTNGNSRGSVMTPSGRYVAFTSAATNFVTADTNGLPDVFVRDLQLGTTTLASVGALTNAYSPATGFTSSSESPQITPDGRYVAFYSTATNLLPRVNTAGEIYVRDLVAGQTIWASTNARAIFNSVAGSTNIVCCNYSLSDNDRYVAYEAVPLTSSVNTGHGLILRYGLQTGLTDLIYTNATVQMYTYETIHNLSITPDGSCVAFAGTPPGGLATQSSIYLWNASTGTNLLVSAVFGTNTPAAGLCDSPLVSTNGQYVAFLNSGYNLVTNQSAGWDVYLRDTQAGITHLVDANTNGVGAGVEPTTVPALSDNGSVVAFDSANLLAGNRHLNHDVFARNVPSGVTTLISAAAPALISQTPDGDSGFTSFSVSSNGEFIAFYSDADNLVANDTNGFRDVFVHNLLSGTNLLVSVNTNGNAPGDSLSTDPAISGNGRYVAFTSSADNLVSGDTNQASDVFVRDLQAGTTTLVSVNAGGVHSANGASSSPVISADGNNVLFQSLASNLVTGSITSGTTNLFFRNLLTKTTYALTTSGVLAAAMTPNGQSVAFIKETSGGSGELCVWNSQTHSLTYTNSETFPASNWPILAVSPNGQEVAFVVASPAKLMVANVLSNTVTTVTNLSPNGAVLSLAGLTFSQNGQFLTCAQAGTLQSVQNVYLYDLQARTNLLVSQNFGTALAGNPGSDSPVISPNGRFVAYRSLATNLVSSSLNSAANILVYDSLNQVTILLSVNATGAAGADDRSLQPLFSADSQMLFFQSWGSDIAGVDYNNARDLFAVDLTGLAATATGGGPTNGAPGFIAQLSLIGVSNSAPTITWPLAAGQSYQVQYKTNLSDTVWLNLPGGSTFLGSTGYASDPSAPTAQRFYRIVLNP